MPGSEVGSDVTSDRRRTRLLAVAVAAVAGAVVFALAVDLFPYHSVNDDEAVYLTQAAMLLEGKLFLRPGDLRGLVRPWFFVARETPTGVLLYSKYSPVPAAVFAVGAAVGVPRLSLALVAAGNAALVYALAAAAFDRRTGLLAATLLLTSPLFLLSSSVFLPYAPTTLFQLGFALAYVRAVRRDDRRYAALAGACIGVAFFARPYTAVLFAAPFVAHALWSLRRAAREGSFRPALARQLTVALPGLAFVGVTLGYNAAVTGDPLVFPYQAFGPQDGVGFGRRELLGYERNYTPALAARATAEALALLASRWGPAGYVGTALALAGAGFALRENSPQTRATVDAPDREVVAILAGLVPSVVLGNAYFWGTLNALSNGLVHLLGPFYHFDLLLPLSAFGAAGATGLWRRARRAADARRTRVAFAILLIASVSLVAAATHDAVDDPYEANRHRTENLAATYEPFADRDFDRALVFTPDPYGNWLHHPFQYLRNDPGFDGPVVYVLDEGAAATFRALDAADDRRPYRFAYRGEWTGAEDPVESRLTPLRVLDGERVTATTTVGVPDRATAASIRLESRGEHVRYRVDGSDGTLRVEWSATAAGVRVTNHPRTGGADRIVLPEGATEVDLVVTFTDRSGSSVTYRQTASVDAGEGRVRVVWPPETRVCRLRTDCGREGYYVGPDGDYVDGISVNATARVV